MLLLVNEHGVPSFLFPNLSSYDIKNQLAKFEKNLKVGSILVEWPLTEFLTYLVFGCRSVRLQFVGVRQENNHKDEREGVLHVLLNYPGGDSHMEQTGMLDENFEFNP